MSILSNLKLLFKPKERRTESDIPIFRKETHDKILETRILPLKIPTVLELGERLGSISSDLTNIKRDMITKHWLATEYDEGGEIIEKLEVIEQKLNNLEKITAQLNDLSSKLSCLTKEKLKELIVPEEETQSSSPTEKILDIISEKKKINYSELKTLVNISDPTLSKHLKQLLENDKIEKEREGRFIYYSIPASLTYQERTS